MLLGDFLEKWIDKMTETRPAELQVQGTNLEFFYSFRS